MDTTNFTKPEFLLGLLCTVIFAYLVSKYMRRLAQEEKNFLAPKGIDQTLWENAFNTPAGVQSNNQILGFGEAILYFIAFSFGKPELIVGWLVFKVASKWETWNTIMKIPEEIKGCQVDPFNYISAKNKVASYTLQRWLLGNLGNILAGGLGIGAGIWIVKLQSIISKNLVGCLCG